MDPGHEVLVSVILIQHTTKENKKEMHAISNIAKYYKMCTTKQNKKEMHAISNIAK